MENENQSHWRVSVNMGGPTRFKGVNLSARVTWDFKKLGFELLKMQNLHWTSVLTNFLNLELLKIEQKGLPVNFLNLELLKIIAQKGFHNNFLNLELKKFKQKGFYSNFLDLRW